MSRRGLRPRQPAPLALGRRGARSRGTLTKGWDAFAADSPERTTGPVCKWSFSDAALQEAIELINRGDSLFGSANPKRRTFEVVPDPENEKGDK